MILKPISLLTGLSFLLVAGQHISCTGHNPDREILNSIHELVTRDKALSGLHFRVKHGIVRISGTCPSPEKLRETEILLRRIHEIKLVINRAVIPAAGDQDQ